MKGKSPSDLVFERYSLYYRCISKMFENDNREITDSNELSRILKIDSSLIRRDLSLIGRMGKRGMGYSLSALKTGIELFLGKTRNWNIALVGIGNLGNALLRYFINQKSNYDLTAVYDSDPKKVGKKAGSLVIQDFSIFSSRDAIDLAIVTVPSPAAQSVARTLVDGGVKAILNFAPVKLTLPETVFYREVDIIKELDILSGMLSFTENAAEEFSGLSD